MPAFGSGAVSPNRKEIIYRDLALSFIPHPITKRPTIVENEEAVKQGVKNVVLTNKGERFYNPLFGGNITAHLFELFDKTTIMSVKKDIKRAVDLYEPRAEVMRVDVSANQDGNQMAVSIYFRIKATNRISQANFTLERIR